MAYERQLVEALAAGDLDRVRAIQRLNRNDYAGRPGAWDARMDDEFTALFGNEDLHRRRY